MRIYRNDALFVRNIELTGYSGTIYNMALHGRRARFKRWPGIYVALRMADGVNPNRATETLYVGYTKFMSRWLEGHEKFEELTANGGANRVAVMPLEDWKDAKRIAFDLIAELQPKYQFS